MSTVNTEMDPVVSRGARTGIEDNRGQASAVSWAAIFAGAVGAAAVSLLLVILGTGLGFSAVSPWTTEGISASTFGFAAIAWLTITQLAASGMGGYLAGRLRHRWTSIHNDEVSFRDGAHGFLTWALASLLTVVILASAMGSIIGGGVSAGASIAGGAASAVGSAAETATDSATTLAAGRSESGDPSNTIAYFVESLFRDERAEQRADDAARQTREIASEVADIPVGEVTRIFAQALRTGTLPQEDERYVGRLIAQRTGMSQQEAEQRVSDGFDDVQTTLEDLETTAREAADEAREASAYGAFWMFVALLLGAFTASLMAIFGGRQRDD